MKRKHKKYSKPRKLYDRIRIDEENLIREEFGLKNKREIWKAEAKIKEMREKAKKLISAKKEDQIAFFSRLKKIGINVSSISDVLSLDKKNYLQRRLQSVIVRKKLAKTSKGARQIIVHKKVLVDGNVVDSPSYIVPIEKEDLISLKIKNKAQKINLEENTENEA